MRKESVVKGVSDNFLLHESINGRGEVNLEAESPVKMAAEVKYTRPLSGGKVGVTTEE